MRKRPKQARSQVTTEALLDATTHILSRKGWAKLTTNEVADLAGASIGSLYQYFPNKVALIDALHERHFCGTIAALREAARDRSPARITAFVDGVIALHALAPAAHRVLLEDTPRSSDFEELDRAFRAQYEDAWSALVATHVPSIDREHQAVMAHLLSAALSAAVHDAAGRGTLRTPAFQSELCTLMNVYLRAPRNAPEQ
jgi:AcrR family transcriptional regulator